jgi:hypothetical protein
VVGNGAVSYAKAGGGTGSIDVSIPSNGIVGFSVRDMKTNTEDLCGSCHTQGKYKFTAWGRESSGVSASGKRKSSGGFVDFSDTHNLDIMGQYRTSGHANTGDTPFSEFSASAYGSSHQTVYPFDMSITGSGGTGSLRNGGNTSFELTETPDPNNAFLSVSGNTFLPTFTNNYACFQCHNGLGTIDYLEDVQGTSAASVLWGDATITCITCHDPHENHFGEDDLIREPEKLSYNSRFRTSDNPRGGINRFMDGTEITSGTGKGTICLFCHQGRESGLSVYLRIKSENPCLDPYADPGAPIGPSGISFVNPHYLDGGAILWSKNAWEYFFDNVAQQYSEGISAHQGLNCTGCHMADVGTVDGVGGHTFRPSVEVCQRCHGSVDSFKDIPAAFNYDGNGGTTTAFEKIGTIEAIPVGTPAPVSESLGGIGLFGILNRTLAENGIYYDPDSYPYFFNSSGESFEDWTTDTLTAAFNLAWAWKSGGTANCVYVHNAWYGAQVLQDSIRATGGILPAEAERPPEDRGATFYPNVATGLELNVPACGD